MLVERSCLIRQLANLALELWEDSYLEELQQLWKEGQFTKNPKRDKRGELSKQIDGHWQTAEAVAQKAGVSHKSAVKLLQSMAEAGDIELVEQYWTDERFRRRKRFMYRKCMDMTESFRILERAFGICNPHPPHGEINPKGYVHLMED